jgi:hypothetical protein
MFSSVLDIMYNNKYPSTVAYGMTELAGAVTWTVKGSGNYESVGRPIPNMEMKVVHTETGSSLAARQTGEICVRGQQVRERERESFQVLLISILSSGILNLRDNSVYRFLSAPSTY